MLIKTSHDFFVSSGRCVILGSGGQRFDFVLFFRSSDVGIEVLTRLVKAISISPQGLVISVWPKTLKPLVWLC